MSRPLKILLLEDNHHEAELVQQQLRKEKLPCQIKVANDRESFLQILSEFEPDVILSDNSLPQYNASAALKTVRQQPRHIPFILVTGTVSDEFAAGIIKAGADDYVLKDRLERLPASILAALKQKKTEKELLDYKIALDESAIVAITDQKGIITYANENFCRISKYSKEELLGQDHRIINSGHHPAEYIRNLWVTLANGKIWRGEFCNRAKDGSIYWVDATIIPFLNEEDKPYQYLAIRNDITAKKETEIAMRRLEKKMQEDKIQQQKKVTRAVIQAEEKERNRIGQELHDNVNQVLAATRMHLNMAAVKKPELKELVSYPMELINTAIQELRLLSARQVTPLKDLNLEELISSMLLTIKTNSPVKTKFLYALKEPEPEDDLKLNIYRLIQEQVNNILKHGDAKHILVEVKSSGDHLHILVKDDGKGFDPSQRKSGIGLTNMQNRVESFNGEMKIESQPGNGCRIETMIPY